MKCDVDKKLNQIVERTVDNILERIRPGIEEEVSDLVEAMAEATREFFETYKGCRCDRSEKAATETEEKGEEGDDDETVQISINTNGIQLDPEDRLKLSQLIAKFVEDHSNRNTKAELVEEPPEEDDDHVLVERVVITTSDDGKGPRIERTVSKVENPFSE